jgi:predicted dehydrogenase
MDRMRIGVIGLGFGRHHVRTLANMEDVELTAVADLDPNAAGGLTSFADKYGAEPFRDGIEMMAQADLDAVSICTSPRYRRPLIEFAAEHALPMIVEKPWATDLDHAHELAEVCRRHNATVMTAFSFRYHPAIVRLRNLMDDDLGEAWTLNGSYVFAWAPPAGYWLWDPENGNGFFNENSCHLFDAVCYLLGDPVSLTAEAIGPLDRPSEQAAAVTMRFADGAIAALTIGCLGAGAFHTYPRVDVTTVNGQAHLHGEDHVWDRLTWATRADEVVHTVDLAPETLGDTRYTHGLRHFIHCLRTGRQPATGVEAGVRTVAIAMAVYESARSGAKVDLSW